MTVTLPSPAKMVVALVLIAAVFVAGLRYGRSHRPAAPAAHAAAASGPVVLQQGAAAPPAPSITAPPATPAVPTLQAFGPGVLPSGSTVR